MMQIPVKQLDTPGSGFTTGNGEKNIRKYANGGGVSGDVVHHSPRIDEQVDKLPENSRIDKTVDVNPVTALPGRGVLNLIDNLQKAMTNSADNSTTSGGDDGGITKNQKGVAMAVSRHPKKKKAKKSIKTSSLFGIPRDNSGRSSSDSDSSLPTSDAVSLDDRNPNFAGHNPTGINNPVVDFDSHPNDKFRQPTSIVNSPGGFDKPETGKPNSRQELAQRQNIKPEISEVEELSQKLTRKKDLLNKLKATQKRESAKIAVLGIDSTAELTQLQSEIEEITTEVDDLQFELKQKVDNLARKINKDEQLLPQLEEALKGDSKEAVTELVELVERLKNEKDKKDKKGKGVGNDIVELGEGEVSVSIKKGASILDNIIRGISSIDKDASPEEIKRQAIKTFGRMKKQVLKEGYTKEQFKQMLTKIQAGDKFTIQADQDGFLITDINFIIQGLKKPVDIFSGSADDYSIREVVNS